MVKVYIEPLRGKDKPIGSVMIIYAREDYKVFEDVLEPRLKSEGIPYFLDVERIKPGDEWLKKLENAYETSSCGIPILTPNSVKSPWVWYEIGVLHGKGKTILPFLYLVNISEKEKTKFINSLPEFITRPQYSTNPDEIIESAKEHIFFFGKFFDNPELNKRVVKKLTQLRISLELENVNEVVAQNLSFGYQIVRFGIFEIIKNEPFNTELEECDRIHKIFYHASKSYDKINKTLKVDFTIPIHRRWGTTFKLFVDVSDLSLIKDVIKILKDNELEDIKPSGSGEKQRIYFLVPEKYINITKEPYESFEILNNYIFPV